MKRRATCRPWVGFRMKRRDVERAPYYQRTRFMTTIRITGMSCAHCASAVEKALTGIKGVSNVAVDLDKGEARYDTDTGVEQRTVEEAVKKAGYGIG